MKRTTIFITAILFIGFLLVSCEKKDEIILKSTSYQVAGLSSEFSYNYLPYSADSAQLTFYIDTIGGGVIPCSRVQLLLADSVISGIDSIPTTITCRVPLIYDSIFNFVHRCYLDTNYCSLSIPIYVYKGEIVSPNHYVYEIKFPFLIYVTNVIHTRKDPFEDFWNEIVNKYDL